jgi:hypothetical protein
LPYPVDHGPTLLVRNTVSLFRGSLPCKNFRSILTLQIVSGGGSQGSLILGGYDANRIKRNEVTFPFADDVERVHSVVLQNIYFTLQLESIPTTLNTFLKHYDIYPVIESNRPYIFLLEDVCDEIARHVGAQHDK